ncbi:MAG: acyltransferase [Bacteroidetes bacterium]|jgi:peptidoglycan/LPS O-acetylase OafA/YrhL|nr:acyltransferase [Bacteroidota bacterium]
MATQRYYRPELDVLRLIAFLSVFFTHRMDLAPIDATKYFWGYHISLVGVFGVPVFFLLSAFLITELLTREQEQTGKVHPKAFYARRILRIWPLYFTVFFGLVLLAYFFPVFGKIPKTAWAAFSLFAGNWYICINQWIHSYPINPLWSISVEEQFYILIPLIAAYSSRRVMKVTSFLFIGIAYVFIFNYARHPISGFSSEWTNSFVQFQFFAAGILLSLYLKGRQPKWKLIVRFFMALAALGCWLIASMVCGIHADAPHLSTEFEAISGWLLILLGAILLFLSLLGISDKFLPKPLVYLGRISYGLYVFHALMFFLVFIIFKDELAEFSKILHLYEWRNSIGAVVAFILTVSVATLSYRFFEKPFLRLKKRFTFIASRD